MFWGEVLSSGNLPSTITVTIQSARIHWYITSQNPTSQGYQLQICLHNLFTEIYRSPLLFQWIVKFSFDEQATIQNGPVLNAERGIKIWERRINNESESKARSLNVNTVKPANKDLHFKQRPTSKQKPVTRTSSSSDLFKYSSERRPPLY